MASQFKTDEGFPLADRATLSLISALEEETNHSQRSLTQRIGIALGLTNTLLKRATRKGLIKIKQVPAKRFAYYVTPKGFAEKSRLVSEYLRTSLSFFRESREQYENLFGEVAEAGYKKTMLFGIGELAEIASLSSYQSNLTVDGIVHPGGNQSRFVGLPVFSRIDGFVDDEDMAIVITDAKAPQEAYDTLVKVLDADRVFAPDLLHIRKMKAENR